MRLAQYDACVPLSMLWTVGEPVRDDFYMTKLFRVESKAFNALGGNVREGPSLAGVVLIQDQQFMITSCSR
jgi:hypothetical protein